MKELCKTCSNIFIKTHNRQKYCLVCRGLCFNCKKPRNYMQRSLCNVCYKNKQNIVLFCPTCKNSFKSIRSNAKFCSAKCRSHRNASLSDLEWFFRSKIARVKNNAKKRKIKFEITANILLGLWQKQNGLCYFTKLPMSLQYGDKNYKNCNPFLCSVDRLNNNLGYISDNIVLCCYSINNLKGECDLNTLKKFFSAIHKQNKLDKIEIYKFVPDAKLPERNLNTDAGADIFAQESVFIKHGETKTIRTGIAINTPIGYVTEICDRSNMGKKGLSVGGGVLDAGFSGEVSIILHNLTNKSDHDFFGNVGYQINKGDKIAQILVSESQFPICTEVTTLWESIRGNKGFGSSGR